MSEKKELNKEDLEKITGGKNVAEFLPSNHGKHIGKYEAEGHIGDEVYIVDDSDPKCYYWGTLKASYEKWDLIGTKRKHDIYIKGRNDYFFCTFPLKTTQTFNGDDNTLFLKWNFMN